MKPSLLSNEIAVLLAANVPVYIEGAPGVGKSDIARQSCSLYAQMLGVAPEAIGWVDIRPNQMDPTEIKGVPSVVVGDDGSRKTVWCAPSFFPTDPDSVGIMLIDELPAAPPLVQASMYQLFLDRRLGEYQLPKGWRIIAAGNRTTDKAVVHRIPTPLINRMAILSLEVDTDDWVNWAVNNGIDPMAIAFIRFRPNLLSAFDPRVPGPFASPRSWAMVSRVLSAKPGSAIEYDLIKSLVGEGPAAEFVAFVKIYRSLPDVESILTNPEKADVPKDPATMYALCGSLSHKVTRDNSDAAFTYINRMPVEYQILTVSDTIRRDKSLCNTKSFIGWARKNSDVVLGK